jgi:predicted anti-sigma-YlaC factor YlaD
MQHINQMLDEYYDGELSPARRRQVEAHLAKCADCRAELEQKRRLSALLQEVPLPDAFSSPQLFNAQIALRLERRQVERSRYPGAAWHVVPVLLLVGLVVLQGLLALLGGMAGLFRMLGGLGFDLGTVWPLWNTVAFQLGSALRLSPASLATVLSVALMGFVYLASLAVFVPYVGWVRTLWRSSQSGLDGKEVQWTI